MGKKARKEALKFIIGNDVIVKRLSDALGCDEEMTMKERRIIVKDMIKTYRDETCTDSFTVNVFGAGKKKNSSIFNKNYFEDTINDELDKYNVEDDYDSTAKSILKSLRKS